MPAQDADSAFDELLQDLPPELEELAREFKAFTRSRKIKSPRHLLRAVLAYAGLDYSARDVAGQLTLLSGEALTDTAVTKRLRACVPWVRALVGKMLGVPERAGCDEQTRILVVDSTTVQAPGATGTQYRVHICLDLARVQVVGVVVSDVHVGESLTLFDVRAGDWVLADRGYSKVPAMSAIRATQAELIVRLNHGAVVAAHPDLTPIRWREVLDEQAEGTVRTLPVVLMSSGGAQQIRGVVHAYRLPELKAEAARRAKCAKGRTPSQDTLFLAGWVLVFTTLDPEGVSAETVLALYGCRWQVELWIKRCKSLLHLDLLRARYQGLLADLWLHGKLLYIALIERRTARRVRRDASHIASSRGVTWWRVWKLIVQELTPRISGAAFWRPEAFRLAVRVLAERPRRRLLQCLPALLPHSLNPAQPLAALPLSA